MTNSEYKRITSAQAKEMMDGGGVVILDVRTQAEFDEKRIENAVLLPDFEVAARATEVLPDKNAVVLVYCRSGRRSEIAAKLLIEMGYAEVYDFGGIIDWEFDTVGG